MNKYVALFVSGKRDFFVIFLIIPKKYFIKIFFYSHKLKN